ncbi:crotonobetainyl-CoA:carnitine CoA-transferase CaiB-like acyl-CoA transferase [Actinokineospora baliensis]|uniref:CoA transferase n=1 Tax=Actinokineospora baliensis TaxID=547056 RepID=UPI0019569A3A|nr:CoA transferase [Actinokineospora baliensis]MBM7775539.1 crotonobetainyl-CoA:carnitine CoA-transferase CaiB-like acyl-CoA transferase [Actinokineospora baliensis]
MTGTLLDAKVSVSGSGATATVLRDHLAHLGLEVVDGGATDLAAEAVLDVPGGRHVVRVDWAGPVAVPGLRDEATVQAACGVMHVHGRSTGSPRGLGVDHCGTAAGVLAVTGLLAGVLREPLGEHVVETSVAEAALLTVSQYIAAAGEEFLPGGPPFTTADGVRYELEALVPEMWGAFWTALGAPVRAIGVGWRPFQFRYATATAPLPVELYETSRAATFDQVRAAARASGAGLTTLRHPADLPEGGHPWQVTPLPDPAPGVGLETVWEAGRRIQAPMAANLLRLLGARVVRVEPPDGDPLRGMPPTTGGLSARWLALNRGKEAVEVDLKDPNERQRLRDQVRAADVFLHNWAPGNAERWGLTAADLPGTVHVHTSGWADAPEDDLPIGTDFMVQARTGLADLVRPLDEVAAPSMMTLVDVLGGLIGAEATLVGLLARRATGRGVSVRSSLLGAATALSRGVSGRRPVGFRRPVDGQVGGVPVVTDLTDLLVDPAFAAVLSRDEHGSPALTAPWRFQ